VIAGIRRLTQIYRLCHVRQPERIIVEFAAQIG
jgi:hypothetical protein